MEDTIFKELEIILSDFSCDKKCPYCTAKITEWPCVIDDLYQLSLYVGQMKKFGFRFRYVTIGGNGEPTLHSYHKLKELVEMFDDYDIPIKRVLTSGNIFRKGEEDKYKLFQSHGWFFELTTTSIDNETDRMILGYDHNYFESESFRKAKVRLNYVLLKNNYDTFLDEIKEFIRKYPNIQTVGLKLLNVNTKTGLVDNKYSEWIIKHAIQKTDRLRIKEKLDTHFSYCGEVFDTFSWELDENHEIYFSWKSSEYGLFDLVYYGNRFITYKLDEVQMEFVPKVYIASRFKKRYWEDGTLDLSGDFRTKLLQKESLFMDYNNESFISGQDGTPSYQYIGPFYNEKASDGRLTSTICEEVVRTENEIIDHCDVFIAYMDETVSPGSVTELIYAAFQGKEIIIFYKVEEGIEYEFKTSNWYPCIAAQQIRGIEHVKCIPVYDEDSIVDWFHKGIMNLS